MEESHSENNSTLTIVCPQCHSTVNMNVSTQDRSVGDTGSQESSVVEAQVRPAESSISLSSTTKLPVKIPKEVSDKLRAKSLQADEFGIVRSVYRP